MRWEMEGGGGGGGLGQGWGRMKELGTCFILKHIGFSKDFLIKFPLFFSILC